MKEKDILTIQINGQDLHLFSLPRYNDKNIVVYAFGQEGDLDGWELEEHLPSNYKIVINKQTGYPFLIKKN
jgi:hypothetical protein